jgi:hypothetical protein
MVRMDRNLQVNPGLPSQSLEQMLPLM